MIQDKVLVDAPRCDRARAPPRLRRRTPRTRSCDLRSPVLELVQSRCSIRWPVLAPRRRRGRRWIRWPVLPAPRAPSRRPTRNAHAAREIPIHGHRSSLRGLNNPMCRRRSVDLLLRRRSRWPNRSARQCSMRGSVKAGLRSATRKATTAVRTARDWNSDSATWPKSSFSTRRPKVLSTATTMPSTRSSRTVRKAASRARSAEQRLRDRAAGMHAARRNAIGINLAFAERPHRASAGVA
jgi:hypothetical protein